MERKSGSLFVRIGGVDSGTEVLSFPAADQASAVRGARRGEYGGGERVGVSCSWIGHQQFLLGGHVCGGNENGQACARLTGVSPLQIG